MKKEEEMKILQECLDAANDRAWEYFHQHQALFMKIHNHNSKPWYKRFKKIK